MNKQKIPKAVREQVWLKCFGKRFEAKCLTHWCTNIITVFDFQCGHNIPESKGGKTVVENLIPLCSRCNQSMNNIYSIDEWNKFGKEKKENKCDFCSIM
jgi:5-methylcytosine-specific restriction endonuclease McrA